MLWKSLCTLFWILVTFARASNRWNKLKFAVVNERTTYNAALEACVTKGSGWSLVDDQSHTEELRAFLRNNSLETVWLKVTKHILPSWEWVDGSTAGRSSMYIDSPSSKCGGVSLQDQNLRSMECSEMRNGFVCEMPENLHCPEKHFTQGCIRNANRELVIGCKAENWFEARTYCRRIGGDLATVTTEGKLQTILNYITNCKLADKCSWLFVGLRLEDWVINNGTIEKNSIPGNTQWGVNEPRSGEFRCVQLQNVDTGYFWKTAPCSETAPVVCQKLSDSTKEQKPLSIVDKCKEDSNKGLFIAGLVSLALSLLIVVVFIIGFYQRKRNIRAATSKAEESKDQVYPEIIPLITKSSENISFPVPNERIITVVMFSIGINENNININVPASGTVDEKAINAARTISGEFSEVLGTSVVNPASKEKLKENLRVVNLRATDASFKLGNTQTEDFLSYLTENADSIDVIYLPGIRLPVSDSILSKLKKLREKCVILCHAKRFITEIPSSEGISVGIFKSNEEEIRSGIVDILLKEKEERATDANTNLAVSKFTGMIAAILYEAKQRKDPDLYQSLKNTCTMRKYMINFVRPTVKPDVPGYGFLQFDNATRKACIEELEKGYKAIVEEDQRTQIIRPNVDQSFKWETREGLEQSLASIKQHNGQPISIVFAASPVIDPMKDIEGIPIKSIPTFDPCGEVGDLGEKFLKYISEMFKHTSAQPAVEITSIPIRFDDKESASDWIIYHKAVMKIKQLKPDIVYISSDSRSSPRGLGIKRIIMESKRQSIFITGAKGYEGPVAPPAFPSESVMTISRKGGPQGSLVDFISSTDQQQVDPTDDDLMKEAWVAAADTVCAAVAVLLKARELGTLTVQNAILIC